MQSVEAGDFIHIIRTTIERICDKIEVSEEIHTVMSEKALEQKIMCCDTAWYLRIFTADITGVYRSLIRKCHGYFYYDDSIVRVWMFLLFRREDRGG